MIEGYGKGVKYSLLAANLIIFTLTPKNVYPYTLANNSPSNNLRKLSGVLVLALGIWTVSDRSFMERLLGIKFYVASAVMLIITGTVVAFISLLGSLGAYKELRSMLKSYFVILLTLLAVIVTLATLGYVFRAQLDDRLQREMFDSMRFYGNDPRLTEAWDSMQTEFECCGMTLASGALPSFESWRRNGAARFNQTDSPVVPESCCRSQEDDQTRRACLGRQPRKENTYSDGCYDKMKSSIKGHSLAIGLAGGFAIIFILSGLALSGTLFFLIGRRQMGGKSFNELD